MKAIIFENFGAATDVLNATEIEKPQPQKGEVLVRIHTSGVNPSDVKKRAGSFQNLLDDGYVIPHSDGAGMIEAVGEGVDKNKIGQKVWVYQAQHRRRFGSVAQYICLPEDRAPELPETVDYATGACYGIPVMTAHRCVFADGDPKGQTILVTGGAGKVGYYAIQWAVKAGANVIATASNDEDAALCKSLGATHIVNHREEGWGGQILDLLDGGKVDRVVEVEFGYNLTEVLKVLRIGGTIATYSSARAMNPTIPFYKMLFMDVTTRFVLVYDMPESAKQQAISDIAKAEKEGWLKHRIAKRFAFDDCAKAHEFVEAGSPGGCVIVEID